ncbi:MAG TPA: phosphate ABC transporter permease subunit PstC [Gaiellaceae bacterium]|nr:phosphate ABC transporter permease subunit PstC [Gaiellaceae bacterium]
MAVASKPATGPAAFQRRGRFRPGDTVLYVLTLAAALSGVVLLVLIARELLMEASPAIHKFGSGFLTTEAWDKLDPHHPAQKIYGARSFIFGTAVTSFGALLLATPIAIAIALFLTELAPRGVRGAVGVLVDMLAAIPSVVLGLWGILVLGPFIVNTLAPALHGTLGWLPIFSTKPSVGSNVFAAILILTIMIVPIISSVCRELFLGVPQELKDGALALGATRWEVARGVTFPYARAGIAAAVILGLGRAVGEAIAVTQVIGNAVAIHWSLFDAGDTLASRIAGQYIGADTRIKVASLVYLALILLVFSLIANLLAQIIVRRVASRHRAA